MYVKQIHTGGDRNFGYLVADEDSKLAAVIDPSFSPELIYENAKEAGFTITYIFNTHNHFDHTNGNGVMMNLTRLYPLQYGDLDARSGLHLDDGARLPLGRLTITILHTPGHTSDSICLYIDDAVFTGDTLFVGKVGGTDFGTNARIEYKSLYEKLMTLPDDTRVFPGHNYGIAPESTIGHERKTNPFLLQPDIYAFIDLKKNWLEYKRIHSIA